MKVVRTLFVEPDRTEVAVGDVVTVRVLDDRRRPVEGAVVVTGREERRTDPDGRCRFTFRAPGFKKITAYKNAGRRVEYEPGTALVRCLPHSRRRIRHRVGSRRR